MSAIRRIQASKPPQERAHRIAHPRRHHARRNPFGIAEVSVHRQHKRARAPASHILFAQQWIKHPQRLITITRYAKRQGQTACHLIIGAVA